MYNGNLTITAANTVISGLDVHGWVDIQAANVTIKNSILRGGNDTQNVGTSLIKVTSANASNFLLEDSELVPDYPSLWVNGVAGENFTLLRDNIHGTADTVDIYGSNVAITDTWLHDTVTYADDPNHGGGQSHNDGVQIEGGSHIYIQGNTIAGGINSAMQVTQNLSSVTDLTFDSNWASGGACTVNLADKPLPSMTGITVTNNVFSHTSSIANCAVIVNAGVSVTLSGNVWAGTATPVVASRG